MQHVFNLLPLRFRSENNSRQVSPAEMTEFSDDKTASTPSISSPTTELECVANHSVPRFNQTTSHHHSENPEPSLDRENYGVLGSSGSMENVQRPDNMAIARPPPTPGQTPTTTTNRTVPTPQQSADSAQVLPPIGTVSSTVSSVSTAASTNDIVPLYSQHSNDSATNSTHQELENSIPTHALSQQATRPQSLICNSTPNQLYMQASPGSTLTPTNFGAVQRPLRMNSTESNTSHTSRNSEGRVSSATTPIDLSAAVAYYTASQNSLNHDSGHGLPYMDRSTYRAVGCSQENVQRPLQCTQSPGQVPGNTTPMGCSCTPQERCQYYGNPQSLGASSPNMSNHIHGLVPSLHSQHSNDSTSSGASSVADNSISALSQTTYAQRQSLTSAPFVHNQATTGPGLTANAHYSAHQPPTVDRMDSNTSQNSGVNIHTPTDHPTTLMFFSTSPNQDSIYPPSPVTLSTAQYATSVDS